MMFIVCASFSTPYIWNAFHPRALPYTTKILLILLKFYHKRYTHSHTHSLSLSQNKWLLFLLHLLLRSSINRGKRANRMMFILCTSSSTPYIRNAFHPTALPYTTKILLILLKFYHKRYTHSHTLSHSLSLSQNKWLLFLLHLLLRSSINGGNDRCDSSFPMHLTVGSGGFKSKRRKKKKQ
jgi:hypothetical protein